MGSITVVGMEEGSMRPAFAPEAERQPSGPRRSEEATSDSPASWKARRRALANRSAFPAVDEGMESRNEERMLL
jgi:hypothetical protein